VARWADCLAGRWGRPSFWLPGVSVAQRVGTTRRIRRRTRNGQCVRRRYKVHTQGAPPARLADSRKPSGPPPQGSRGKLRTARARLGVDSWQRAARARIIAPRRTQHPDGGRRVPERRASVAGPHSNLVSL